MQYFYTIKTRTVENNIAIINSQHIYACYIDSFLNAIMDTVTDTIFATSGYYQVIFTNENNYSHNINYLSDLRDDIRELLELLILDFSIQIIDNDNMTEFTIWVEQKEYKTSSSAGTVPIKVIDVDNDEVVFYNEYAPQSLLNDGMDFFVDMIYDFFEKGFMVILNDVRLNNIGYNMMLEIKQDENRKMFIEMEYENEQNITEKILLYHEEYLHKGIEQLVHQEDISISLEK